MRRIAPQADHSSGPGRLGLIAVLALIVFAVLLPGVALVSPDAGSPGSQASPSTTRTSPPPADAGAGEPVSPTAVEQALVEFRGMIEQGLAEGEITRGADRDIGRKVEEALKEYERDDVAKALEKLQDAQEKVDDAVEKGHITAPTRAEAIRDAIASLGTAMGG